MAVVGARGAASLLTVRVVAHHADGLTELATAAGTLWLPRIADATDAILRVRIMAQDVILSRDRPAGLSALNILQGAISDLRLGEGPGAMVTLTVGEDRLAARITRRSAEALGLAPGQTCHAVIKSVAVAPDAIGTGLRASPASRD